MISQSMKLMKMMQIQETQFLMTWGMIIKMHRGYKSFSYTNAICIAGDQLLDEARLLSVVSRRSSQLVSNTSSLSPKTTAGGAYF